MQVMIIPAASINPFKLFSMIDTFLFHFNFIYFRITLFPKKSRHALAVCMKFTYPSATNGTTSFNIISKNIGRYAAIFASAMHSP